MSKPWKTQARIKRRERQLTEGGKGFVTVYTPEMIELAVYVDWAAIRDQLAQRAFDSKGGKAKALHGAIVVKVCR